MKKSVSYILGVVSICTCWTTLPGLIIGIIGLIKSREKNEKKLNITGIILSTIITIGAILALILAILGLTGLFVGVTQGTADAIVDGIVNPK